jgi:hypothetical protein
VLLILHVAYNKILCIPALATTIYATQPIFHVKASEGVVEVFQVNVEKMVDGTLAELLFSGC